MKICGFLGGCYGDIIMGIPLARKLKSAGWDVTLAFNQKYQGIQYFLLNFSCIDHLHIWEGYDDKFPTKKDKEFLDAGDFNYTCWPMAKHTRENWYLHDHQIQELSNIFNIGQVNLQIEKPQYTPYHRKNQKKKVALCLFGETRGHEKSFSVERAKDLAKQLETAGYSIIQYGGKHEPEICKKGGNPYWISTSIFSIIEECDYAICVDSALCWALSAYQFPVIGVYNYNYYSGAKSARNWQPLNPNAIYLEAGAMLDISNEQILSSIPLLTEK